MPISDLPPIGADQDATLIERFRRARRDPTRAVLEGFHAVKHAIRFHAALERVCAVDPDELRLLVGRLAPDIGPELSRLAHAVPPALFAELAPVPPETGIIAVARRRQADGAAILGRAQHGAGRAAGSAGPSRQSRRGGARGRRGRRGCGIDHGAAGSLASSRAARLRRACTSPCRSRASMSCPSATDVRSSPSIRTVSRSAPACCAIARFWHSARSGAASVRRCWRQRTARSRFPCVRGCRVSAWRARSR